MADFSPYIDQVAALPSEAASARRNINSWEELWAWLDKHQTPEMDPVPERFPIIPSILPLGWKENLRRSLLKKSAVEEANPTAGWERVVEHRRRFAMGVTFLAVALILYVTKETLVAEQMPFVTMNIYLGVYAVMTWFLASNFFKLCIGSWYAMRGKAANPWHPAHRATNPRRNVRVAIIYPVYHEDVARVAAGMAATWSSLVRDHPEMARYFDSFLLSDSRKPEYWVAEQAATYRLREAFPAARFFYRRRGSNLNAKMGNTIDFCRRWGYRYDYLVVMDADSVMSGTALVDLLRMMEGNERIGILQTNPKPILRKSLFGRMNQFAGRLYGSVFSYSLQAVHMGHASYIGHNAMIRMRPFIQHCVLPDLSGPVPWGGKPLSHDIIESALMARAGYEVWFLPDVEGSYEEIPANMLGFLIRERRWMQGNLQHLRLLSLSGLRSTHRETFLTGAMGYMAAPLWAVFLVVSAYGMIHFLKDGTIGTGDLGTLEVPMTLLLLSSIVFLFMPRLLAIIVNIKSGTAETYGGKAKLLLSLVVETVFSFFFSPIMMVYITKFVWLWVKRKSISWGTQQRDDSPMSWKDCFHHFGWVGVIGATAWIMLYREISGVGALRAAMIETVSGGWASPGDLLFWFFPILAGLSFSPLLARFTSKSFPKLRSFGLFLIPEEVSTPRVVLDTIDWESRIRSLIPDPEDIEKTLDFAKSNVHFYLRHRTSTRRRPHVAHWLIPKIISGVPLDARQTLLALGEKSCFDAIHQKCIDVNWGPKMGPPA